MVKKRLDLLIDIVSQRQMAQYFPMNGLRGIAVDEVLAAHMLHRRFQTSQLASQIIDRGGVCPVVIGVEGLRSNGVVGPKAGVEWVHFIVPICLELDLVFCSIPENPCANC